MTTNSEEWRERDNRMWEREERRELEHSEYEAPPRPALPPVVREFAFERLYDGERRYWKVTHLASGESAEFSEFADVGIFHWCEERKARKVAA